MKIGIPKEIHPGEKRVATTPEVAEKIIQLGFQVSVESGARQQANISDEAYKEVGCSIRKTAQTLWKNADIVIKVRPSEFHPELAIDETELLSKGGHLISFIWPAQNKDLMQKLVDKQATVLAMDCVPRLSRSQKLDALSSMANIAGYRAVIEAAQHFDRFFTGQITAAGKVLPAKILVIGAGVAGLAAIGAAKSMGAIVRAFDTRPEVKEQIESMDAEFLMLDFAEDGSGSGGYAKTMSKEFIDAEMALFARQAMQVDIIITTALIPGKPTPKLITAGMVESMKPGSVIVDLAGEQGGNCALTEKDKVVVKSGVTIIGYTNLPSRMAAQSSQLYATNISHLLTELCPEKNATLNINMEDDVIRGTTVIKQGKITWPPPEIEVSATPAPQTEAPAVAASEKTSLIPAGGETNINSVATRGRIILPGLCCASLVYVAFYCFCLVLLYWLSGYLECLGLLTYAFNECDQCHQRHYYYRCCTSSIKFRIYDHTTIRPRDSYSLDQYCRWLFSHPTHAGNV
ncbi:NAD(P) transhydrogenase subunit alpha [methanotrophic bacterial endosymbiont of Bathymodiolus sp.]|nr:NAD(P) transhydrogenase subunit alpha [methanotrophic bacterial endosymbiont of Bathymodiolus sp.]